MRVCFAGTFEPSFPRNRNLLRLLRESGHEVTICREELWGPDRQSIPTQGVRGLVLRALVAYPRLAWKFLRSPRPDVILIGYPGWFDVPVLKTLARIRRVPVVLDIFISLYDTVVSDRGLLAPSSLQARFLRLADTVACRLADRVVADTPAHAEFYASLTGTDPGRFGVVWLGAQEDIFGPVTDSTLESNLVLFHGTFVPLQGLDTVIAAAEQLDADDVRFRIIGSGQDFQRIRRLVKSRGLGNVELMGLLPVESLPGEIARASICLGIFGESGKAMRVIPNKLFECLAVGRPVVTADTPAVRSAFRKTELALTIPGDPKSLATTIRRLLLNTSERERLASAGHNRFLQDYRGPSLGLLLDEQLTMSIDQFRDR